MTHLAGLVGVQPRSITAYERGEFSPSEDILLELARHLRFPMQFFLAPTSMFRLRGQSAFARFHE